ncbi:hypothetical protein JD844_021867 [Phrynosoma platyrhinos]|uniref:Uncharacterized protein n=1 Tax=Phrynosoma platyrhinos TaxID=52577 RepID=A0ABQ7SV29_PHRPL|nr:hypothetical protein JD844_021867 [Phrynosoma platyrhinos]
MLSKYVRQICSKICFRDIIYKIILILYSLNRLMLTQEFLDCVLYTVISLSKAEKALDFLNLLLKLSDKCLLHYVESVLKRRHIFMICKD